jgi:hypothetical protein
VREVKNFAHLTCRLGRSFGELSCDQDGQVGGAIDWHNPKADDEKLLSGQRYLMEIKACVGRADVDTEVGLVLTSASCSETSRHIQGGDPDVFIWFIPDDWPRLHGALVSEVKPHCDVIVLDGLGLSDVPADGHQRLRGLKDILEYV